MNMQTLKLTDICKKWRDALSEDESITNFCLEKYGKAPLILTGISGKTPPTEENCPYIIILPGGKVEGELSEYQYAIAVGWAIKNENQTVDGQKIDQDGIYESDDLGQLIYSALFAISPDNPITNCDYELNPIDNWPQFTGQMTLTIEITPAIGGSISY